MIGERSVDRPLQDRIFEKFAALDLVIDPRDPDTLYAALEWDRGPVPIHIGIGRGLTDATDKWTIKAIFAPGKLRRNNTMFLPRCSKLG